jgi:magnesium-transporting ATPase (P-type)
VNQNTGLTNSAATEHGRTSPKNRVKTLRWLFYISLAQLLAFFVYPAAAMLRSGTPAKLLPYIQILAALTVGLCFALIMLTVSVCCLIVDEKRRTLYLTMSVLMGAWILWAIVSWTYIEHMDYLL